MERTAQTLILSLLGSGVFGWLRPVATNTMSDDAFQAAKFLAPPAEVILAGDSRTQVGLSPKAMREILPRTILNFGWSRLMFSAEYLAEIERHLTTADRERAVVLGITPWSLTTKAEHWNEFTEVAERPRVTMMWNLWVANFANHFVPVAQLYAKSNPSERVSRINRYVDGWRATHVEPLNPDDALPGYVRNFGDGNTMSVAVLTRLCNAIRRWSSAGVTVFAFRPPTTSAMEELENRLSGFDKQRIANALTSAGAAWLPVAAGYESYDGSHLQDDAAIRFSRDLAHLIVERWPSRRADAAIP